MFTFVASLKEILSFFFQSKNHNNKKPKNLSPAAREIGKKKKSAQTAQLLFTGGFYFSRNPNLALHQSYPLQMVKTLAKTKSYKSSNQNKKNTLAQHVSARTINLALKYSDPILMIYYNAIWKQREKNFAVILWPQRRTICRFRMQKRTVNGCACPVDGGRVCKPSIHFLSCTDGQGCARPGLGKHFDSWTTTGYNILQRGRTWEKKLYHVIERKQALMCIDN